MTRKPLNSRHTTTIDSCTLHLHTWKPFHPQTLSPSKTLESITTPLSTPTPPNGGVALHNKRPSDRPSIETLLDMSKLSLFDDDRVSKREKFRWIARKRRRRGSRSVSGSDKSVTQRRCYGVGAVTGVAYGACTDLVVAAGTDSSGEFFVNGDANWSSDVSEAKNSRREVSVSVRGRGRGRDVCGLGGGERDSLGSGPSGSWQIGVLDAQGNESGYGSEPGYRGDAELGYGDEFDEEEEDGRVLFWGGERLGGHSRLMSCLPAIVTNGYTDSPAGAVEVGVVVTVAGTVKDEYPDGLSLTSILRAISTISDKDCTECAS
ncbi:hypothetical protein GIB67_004576 [Kingdonia uniflora]|uniref:Uncharacterized protein n=1 Tax=Kingdonia uniflora TaxID=39325 RepID=A0A7J7ML83_9MAGN|nr:hypothetical protein GIB67_004576 [Kingdonia uniflora]